MLHAGRLWRAGCWHSGRPSLGRPPGRLLSSLRAFSCLSCRRSTWPEGKLFAPGGLGGQQPLGSPSSGAGPGQSSHPAAQPQRGPATVTVTGVPAFSHSRPHCCAAQHPSPPVLSPAGQSPSFTGASFWVGPSSSGYVGRGSSRPQPAAASSPCLLSTQPPGHRDFVPMKEELSDCPSQHILWPVTPILPPTAGAGPSALPGSEQQPFPRRGGGRAAVRPVGSVSGPS